LACDRVIVDLDGTLLDTRARHHAAYADTVHALGGEPLPLARVWRAKRRGVAWDRLLEPNVDPDRFLDLWRGRIEADDMLALDRLQPGAMAALQLLARRGRRAVLVTARRRRDALARQLQGLSLAAAFDAVIATGGGPKHAPITDPERVCRWIGDTEEDIAAARALGVPVTAVTNGIRCASRLAAARPDDLAPTFGVAVRRLLG